MNSAYNIVRLLAVFVVLLLLQVVVFDNLDFLGLCNPFVYVAFVLLLPFGTSTILLMLLASVLGMVVDVASNTPGMHMAACVLVAYVRPYVLRLIAFRSVTYKDGELPGSRVYGTLWFARYTLLMVSIHHVALFLVEQFDSFYLLPTLLRIVMSIVASSLLIVLLENFMPAQGRGFDD